MTAGIQAGWPILCSAFFAQYLLFSANRLMEDQKLTQARRALGKMNNGALDPQLRAAKQVLTAQWLLLNHHPDQALTLLNRVAATNVVLSAEVRIKLHTLLASAYQSQGDLLASLTQCGEVLPLLSSMDRQTMLVQMWEQLQSVNSVELQGLLQKADTENQRGWISLVIAVNQPNANAAQLLQALNRWKTQYPQHPAQVLLANIQYQHASPSRAPRRIVLLLPLQGPLSRQANAVRHGFFAAYYHAKQQNTAPAITVLDTSKGDINVLYRKAVQQGADLIVGPLEKSNLEKLVASNAVTVPTLALNTLLDDNVRINNLYQFALSPMDEATQAAIKAWNDHHARAIIIAPTGDWGDGVAHAFQQQWESLGGRVTSQLSYASRVGYNRSIRHLLNIDQAQQRARQLNFVLNEKVRFIPRRRQDVDAIFLVATPLQAREILPLLRFYYAGDVPVYAISSVYPGIVQPAIDHDLNGVIFDDMPWTLQSNAQLPMRVSAIRQRVKTLWPRSFSHHPRLYALGVDAYNVVSDLDRLELLPQLGVYGATGMLYLQTNQRVYRKLLWARMVGGKPRLLP